MSKTNNQEPQAPMYGPPPTFGNTHDTTAHETSAADNNPQRGFARTMSTGNKVRCSLWCAAIALFAVWMGSWLPLVAIPFVVDVYWTKFMPWTWWKNLTNPFWRSVMSWVDAIVFALIAVWILQNFFVQNFKIPTTSLEKTMRAGDYLLVSKFHYGPRIPMTPLSLPIFHNTIDIFGFNLGDSYLDKPHVAYRRMPGLGDVERYDIVVFNYPPELERPVDKRENYVKRCIGLPGDTLQIVDNVIYIDGQPLPAPRYMQQKYFIFTHAGKEIAASTWRKLGVYGEDHMDFDAVPGFPKDELAEAMGLDIDTLTGRYAGKIYSALLTADMKASLEAMTSVVRSVVVVPAEIFGKDYVYPVGDGNPWTRADYGPLWIPRRGESVELTPWNVELYGPCIRDYEGNTLTATSDTTWLLNGQPATSYTFRMDYYWMMGDNRDNSADSRYWGFVPEDHIVGTPLFVWFSVEPETGHWLKDRILKRVDGHKELRN